MSTPTTCPTCGGGLAPVDDQAEEEAPAETVSQLMNRKLRTRSYPGADRYAALRPRPPGDEAA